jgi:AP-4 complex subunit sigma-1
MAIKFVLMVNKQGQTRLARYTDGGLAADERRLLEAEAVRRCLARGARECAFIDHGGARVVYRRYASLFFLVGVDAAENELAVLEFIHCLVEALDRWFANVCELDIMFGLETAHFVLDEMLANGAVAETNRANVLAPVQLLERAPA